VIWNEGTISVNNTAIIIHKNTLKNSSRNDWRNIFLFHVVVAKAIHSKGLRIGAISIAQITTAVAFIISPNVAITTESII
jgi:hypothetical protein